MAVQQPMAPSRRRENGDCWLWAINDGVVAESDGVHSVEPSTLRATVVRALGVNEARYGPLWDSLAPQGEVEVLPAWDDYTGRVARPGAQGSIVETQAAADVTGMSIAVLDDKGRLAEHVKPDPQPPIGVTRPQHTIRGGIVVRPERGHYEWAKVSHDFFAAMPRYVAGEIRRGGAIGGKSDEPDALDVTTGRELDGDGDAAGRTGLLSPMSSGVSSNPSEWARALMKRGSIGGYDDPPSGGARTGDERTSIDEGELPSARWWTRRPDGNPTSAEAAVRRRMTGFRR